MKKFILALAVLAATQLIFSEKSMKTDKFDCGGKNLEITFIKHGTLMFDFDGTIIHIDPVLMFGTDYSKLPKADIIIVTHEHGDHFDQKAIAQISKPETKIITNQNVSKMMGKSKNVTAMKNGENVTLNGIQFEAKPAYNYTEGHEQFHPKGRDNGFVITLGNKRLYVSGDTEDIPELAALKNIDIAFLSVNQPYTMTENQCVNAAKMFSPKILYPYHYGGSDVVKIANALKGGAIEVRIRELQ